MASGRWGAAILRAMPVLCHHRFAPGVSCAVWEGTETADELAAGLPAPWRALQPASPERQRETLGARRALLSLDAALATRTLGRDGYGKPYFTGEPPRPFSLSHSHGHAAALLADVPCGVDLQRRDEKIARLRSKFERADERAFVGAHADEVAALHVLWGAKESLYKLWGRRGIDWTADMIVAPFATAGIGGGDFAGEVRKGGEVVAAQLAWRWVGAYCLVGAWRVPRSADRRTAPAAN